MDQKAELEINDVVQIIDTCPTPGFIGLLGYVNGFFHDKGTVDVAVYTKPDEPNCHYDYPLVANIEIAPVHLFNLGVPFLKPNP